MIIYDVQSEVQFKEDRLQEFQNRIKAWEDTSPDEETVEDEEEDESAENIEGTLEKIYLLPCSKSLKII